MLKQICAATAVALTAVAVPAIAVTVGDRQAADRRDDERDVVVTGMRDQPGYVVTETNAAKIDAPLRDIPQSIVVVPAQVLRDQRALSLQDALKNVPGIGLGSGDGQRDQVFIRGFSAIADQFVDGFRDDGLYFRDLSNVDRIEVVKGPAAVLYGRGSSGGLINRVTKKPDANIVSAALTGGSFDTKRGEIDLGIRQGQVGARLTGAIEDDGSFRDQQFLKRVAIAPSLLLDTGVGTSLLVQADYLKDRRLTDFGIPAIDGRPVDVPRDTYYGAANARAADVSRAEVWSQTLSFAHRFSDSLSFRNGFRHYRYTLNRRNTNSTAVDAVARTVMLSHGGIDRDEDGWSNQAELTQKLTFIGSRHTLLYGWEQALQVKGADTITSRIVAVTPIAAPVLPTIDPATFTALSASNINRFKTTGLYVQDLVDLGGGIKALVGIRHDNFRQTTRQRIGTQPDLARTDRNWSPRAGLILQPDQAQSYYLSWSRSYQPSGETFALAANNADIAPEKTINREVGAKYTLFDNRLSVQAAAFILKRTGIKGTDPATQRVIPIGTQRTRGVELSATLDLPSGLRAIAGYSYLDGRITESATPAFVGKRSTLTPENQTNVFVTKEFGGRFGVGGGINYVGDRWADPANTTVLPNYVTADALAWVALGPVRMQANVYNLANERYIVSGHGTSPILNVPGAPRSVLVTARLGF